jgi:nucleoside-diphosphate-sugar epimerase
MKILITGAAGGIGSLVTELLNSKYELVLVDNFRNGFKENLPGYFIHNIDVCSNDFINFACEQKPDVILHLAAITSLPDCEVNKTECININVGGTVNVLEAARHSGVDKIIFASTSAVYENNSAEEAPFTEDLSVSPYLFYSLSKKMAEEVCKAYIENYDLKIVTLRFFNILGPNQDTERKSPPLLNYLVKKVVAKEQPFLHSDGNQKRDYVSVYDLVKLIDLILEDENFNSDCYNVSSGVAISVKEIVGFVERTLKIIVNPLYRPSSMLWDSYPQLFETKKPLNKNVVNKETNKFSLGSNNKLFTRYGWLPNESIQNEFEKVITRLYSKINHIKD